MRKTSSFSFSNLDCSQLQNTLNCFCAVSVKAACSEVCTWALPRSKQGLFYFSFLYFFPPISSLPSQGQFVTSFSAICTCVKHVLLAVAIQKSARPCLAASWAFRRSEAEIHWVCCARWTGGCESVFTWHWLRRRIKVSYFAAKWPPLCASVCEPWTLW